MYDRNDDGVYTPTTHQDNFVKAFHSVVQQAKDHLINSGLSKPHKLTKLGNCMFAPDDTGRSSSSPTLYAKLIHNPRTDTFITRFYEMDNVNYPDEQGTELNPHDLFGMYCNVKAAVKIDSILMVKSNVSLQVKLYEVGVQKREPRPYKRLL
jgi:hypothetical protein